MPLYLCLFAHLTILPAALCCQRREFKREEQDIRMSIMPFLQAEEDIKMAHIREKQLENEAELMKGVPNWEVGANVYKTRYMSPMDVFGVR